jgi:hypothetical protein
MASGGPVERRQERAAAPPRQESAPPLVPAWCLALAIAVLLILQATHPFAAHHHTAAPARATSAPAAPCGPLWQVRWLGPAAVSLRTANAVPAPACRLASNGWRALEVHVLDSGAIVHSAGGPAATLSAGGWYVVPLNPRGDTLSVEPAFAGIPLTLIAVAPAPKPS